MSRFAFILAALLSSGIAQASDDMTPGQALQRVFHNEADLFHFDPETRKFSHARQVCTDKILLRMGSAAFGWDHIAKARNIKSWNDAILLRPTARYIFEKVCLS